VSPRTSIFANIGIDRLFVFQYVILILLLIIIIPYYGKSEVGWRIVRLVRHRKWQVWLGCRRRDMDNNEVGRCRRTTPYRVGVTVGLGIQR
jgi:hypothetical protein